MIYRILCHKWGEAATKNNYREEYLGYILQVPYVMCVKPEFDFHKTHFAYFSRLLKVIFKYIKYVKHTSSIPQSESCHAVYWLLLLPFLAVLGDIDFQNGSCRWLHGLHQQNIFISHFYYLLLNSLYECRGVISSEVKNIKPSSSIYITMFTVIFHRAVFIDPYATLLWTH